MRLPDIDDFHEVHVMLQQQVEHAMTPRIPDTHAAIAEPNASPMKAVILANYFLHMSDVTARLASESGSGAHARLASSLACGG